MLLPYERLLATPVMSLQTGAQLAITKNVMVDPRDMTVIAYELEGVMLDEHPSFLRVADVRELSSLGLIIDSSDEFVGLQDVIKIKEIYDFSFDLVGLNVYDEQKRKLGKTSSYSVDSESFVVQQITVKRPLIKSFNDTELLIHRSQIVEVNNERIIVKAAASSNPVTESLREYANPFRQQQSARPDTSDRA